MEIFRDNPKLGCACCTTAVVLVLLLVLGFFSVGTIEPISYGIKYNKFSRNVESSEVYEGGWYLIGPLNSFIQFPRTQVNLDFSDLPGSQAPGYQTTTGSSRITLHFSMQYKLQKDNIAKLYAGY
jgi:hypothetical protein